MKMRNGFVSNSSSSSFVIISARKTGEDEVVIFEDGYPDDCEWNGDVAVDIDKLIGQLQDLKAAGHTVVTISHGGGYNG